MKYSKFNNIYKKTVFGILAACIMVVLLAIPMLVIERINNSVLYRVFSQFISNLTDNTDNFESTNFRIMDGTDNNGYAFGAGLGVTNSLAPKVSATINPKLTPTIQVTPTVQPSLTLTPSSTPFPTPTNAAPTLTPTPSNRSNFNVTRKVYILAFNPIMQSGRSLYAERGWSDPQTMDNQIVSFFKTASSNGLNYQITTYNVINAFPVFLDGRQYNETTYDTCRANSANCYTYNGTWDMLDYNNLLNTYGICSLLNSGQMDELWLYGAGWFGFYEADQAGTGAFNTNGPVINNTTCSSPLNIMGFNVEVGLGNYIEDFGHRMEGTMMTVYTNHGINVWQKYTNTKFGNSDPNYVAGCGQIHYTPNSAGEYIDNTTSYVLSYCNNYDSYPNISYTTPLVSINCTAWNCSQTGYFTFWFEHLPRNKSKDQYGKLNNWWNYFIYPDTVSSNQERL